MPHEPLRAEFEIRGRSAELALARATKRLGFALLSDLVDGNEATRRIVTSTRGELALARAELADARAAFDGFYAYDRVKKGAYDAELVDLVEQLKEHCLD
jgi:hypothetical protein